MVTSAPKSWYMLANSTPTAPLPSTISEAGRSAALVVASSLDRIWSPSMSSPGSVATAEPVAMSTWDAESSCSPSGPATRIRFGAAKLPVPRYTLILFFFIRAARPRRSWPTTWSLRLAARA